jgi:hypothetical protein
VARLFPQSSSGAFLQINNIWKNNTILKNLSCRKHKPKTFLKLAQDYKTLPVLSAVFYANHSTYFYPSIATYPDDYGTRSVSPVNIGATSGEL